MTINERIRHIRQQLNLSQASFAKEISISSGYLASIELGNRHVNDRIIKLICVTFNVKEEWLRHEKGDIYEKQSDPITESAMNTFKELNPEFKEYVLQQINHLLKLQNKKKEE